MTPKPTFTSQDAEDIIAQRVQLQKDSRSTGFVGVRAVEGFSPTDKCTIRGLRDEPKRSESDHTSPQHYTSHPSGIECIRVAEHFTFNLGNVIKYIWRCDHKHPDPLPDLLKARQYINFEIERLEREPQKEG